MAKKTVWLTWLPAGEGALKPDAFAQKLAKMGMGITGAAYTDNLPKHGWSDAATELATPDAADLWIIAGTKADFEKESVRLGLSMTAAVVRSLRRPMPHAFVLGLDHKPVVDDLPTLLQSFIPLDATGPSWASTVALKAVAKQPSTSKDDFVLNVLAHQSIGLWFEIGPKQGTWKGVMFGGSGGIAIKQHGVGARGQLPEKTVLEFPVDDIKAELHGEEFQGCSCRNELGPEDSYFIQVDGQPSTLIIGGQPDSDDPEMWVIALS